MTTLVAEAIQECVARQDLAPIAEEIAASERHYAVSVGPRPTSSSDAGRP